MCPTGTRVVKDRVLATHSVHRVVQYLLYRGYSLVSHKDLHIMLLSTCPTQAAVLLIPSSLSILILAQQGSPYTTPQELAYLRTSFLSPHQFARKSSPHTLLRITPGEQSTYWGSSLLSLP